MQRSVIIRKREFRNKVTESSSKLLRFTKDQKGFVLYLFGLAFALLFLPLISVSPMSGGESYKVWLISGAFLTTMIVILVCMIFLLGWNMSFRFKNIVISYLGFKENDDLINFICLWIILSIFFAIGNTISLSQEVTTTISLTTSYYFTWIYLLGGLVFCIYSVVKTAKEHSGRTKIINVIDEKGYKEIDNKKTLQGLFDHDTLDDEEEEYNK